MHRHSTALHVAWQLEPAALLRDRGTEAPSLPGLVVGTIAQAAAHFTFHCFQHLCQSRLIFHRGWRGSAECEAAECEAAECEAACCGGRTFRS